MEQFINFHSKNRQNKDITNTKYSITWVNKTNKYSIHLRQSLMTSLPSRNKTSLIISKDTTVFLSFSILLGFVILSHSFFLRLKYFHDGKRAFTSCARISCFIASIQCCNIKWNRGLIYNIWIPTYTRLQEIVNCIIKVI